MLKYYITVIAKTKNLWNSYKKKKQQPTLNTSFTIMKQAFKIFLNVLKMNDILIHRQCQVMWFLKR